MIPSYVVSVRDMTYPEHLINGVRINRDMHSPDVNSRDEGIPEHGRKYRKELPHPSDNSIEKTYNQWPLPKFLYSIVEFWCLFLYPPYIKVSLKKPSFSTLGTNLDSLIGESIKYKGISSHSIH